ncbi:DASH family cryptochrome [Glaciecola sp. SC05]|uniref:DASH family cryptochrome n=1 Tax=Glaciecola sp. SC05 TaxID=1987355 RepID=UPI0035291C8C
MTASTMGVHWFRHDLRVTDNEALLKLSQQSERFVGVYVHNPDWQRQDQWACSHMGKYREAFIADALTDLKQRMHALGSQLLVIEGEPAQQVLALLDALKATHLSYELHAGYNEIKDVQNIRRHLQTPGSANVILIEGTSNYLYSQAELPFSLENMPDTFSPFRRKVEKYAKLRSPLAAPQAFKGLVNSAITLPQYHYPTKVLGSLDTNGYPSGESGALARIDDYFLNSDRIATYKETRNGLDGWDFSSRLSMYLAHGCISPSTVYSKIKEYESERVANDSTYWLFFELLWREFFHLQHIKHGARFFARDGIQRKQPTSMHDQVKFEQWCEGQTGYDIVDACMRQLNATGFMSNRGRQLVASCFVHELNLDWRYGAAYFEQQLIDFDVASNYGNWQYLAGVGSDPRGHRQFNLQKQTETYDPERRFINKWLERR